MFQLYADVSRLYGGEYDSVPPSTLEIMMYTQPKYEVTVLVLGKQERPALIETC